MTTAARSPYPGLAPYRVEDAPLFFGRDQEVRIVCNNLLAARITLLYGASGVGKSSLLMAGVGAALAGDARRAEVEGGHLGHTLVIFRDWGDDVVRSFAAHVAQVASSRSGRTFAARDDDDLVRVLDAAADLTGGRILVVLDQFEDYFHQHPRPGAFDAELGRAVAALEVPVNFLISLREEQLGQLDQLAESIPRLFDNRLRLEPLTVEEARRAIVAPLEAEVAAGAAEGPKAIEASLVDVLLNEFSRGFAPPNGAAADAHVDVPLLQVALSRLWSAEAAEGSGVLRLQTLRALGGALHITESIAEEGLALLSHREQAVAAAIFPILITPSGVRIAHSAIDLAAYTNQPLDQVRAVVERLSSAEVRIMRSVAPGDADASEPRFEVFHDALTHPALEWSRRRSEHAALAGEQAGEQARWRAVQARVRRLQLLVLLFAATVVFLVALTVLLAQRG